MGIKQGTAAQAWNHVQHSAGFTVTNGVLPAPPPLYPNLLTQPPLISHQGLIVSKKSRRRFWLGDSGGVRHSTEVDPRRVPVIDQKLGELNDAAKHIQIASADGMALNFWHVYGDNAVDVLGDYNPIYGGRPKKIAQLLLDILPGYKRRDWNLIGSGLAYPVPALIGVRSERMRISAAGLALLDHWAKTFPKFAEFMKPYDVGTKTRETIISQCYDLAMGHRPSAFAVIDEKNKTYRLKADSRELKRLKKQQQIDAYNMIIYQQQQQAIQDKLQQQLKPVWASTLSNSSSSNLINAVKAPANTNPWDTI